MEVLLVFHSCIPLSGNVHTHTDIYLKLNNPEINSLI